MQACVGGGHRRKGCVEAHRPLTGRAGTGVGHYIQHIGRKGEGHHDFIERVEAVSFRSPNNLHHLEGYEGCL